MRLITTAPLPRFEALFIAALGGATAVPDALKVSGMSAMWLARSAFSFAVLARAGGRHRWLVPAWFCNQSLRPLRDEGASIDFYPVDRHGRPDWTRLDTMSGDVLLVVHTLGHHVDPAPARNWCDRQGALLIEDAAHLLLPTTGMGAHADAVCFSPHKMLAIPDGALLHLRQPGGDGPAGATSPKWLAKRVIQALLPDMFRATLPAHPIGRFDDDPPETPAEPIAGASMLSRRLVARSDFSCIAESRLRNWHALADALSGLADTEPLTPPAVPYRFALRCADPERAQALYATLHARRLPAESWPDMPPEVLARPDEFADAIALRREILYLPVHQSLPAGFAERYFQALAA